MKKLCNCCLPFVFVRLLLVNVHLYLVNPFDYNWQKSIESFVLSGPACKDVYCFSNWFTSAGLTVFHYSQTCPQCCLPQLLTRGCGHSIENRINLVFWSRRDGMAWKMGEICGYASTCSERELLGGLRLSGVELVEGRSSANALGPRGASSARRLHVLRHSWELDLCSHLPASLPFPERLCDPFLLQQKHISCKGNRHGTGRPHVCEGLRGHQQLILSQVSCH